MLYALSSHNAGRDGPIHYHGGYGGGGGGMGKRWILSNLDTRQGKNERVVQTKLYKMKNRGRKS